MATWAMVALIGVGVMGMIGLLLAIHGLRGRRMGDHPHCRKCGFDVSGSTGDVCTECGADLTRRRATRTGLRQRRMGMVLSGLLLLLPGVLLTGVLGWGWATEVDWQRHKPAWWLVRDLDSPKVAVSDAAVAELQRRMTFDELSAEATSDVVEWVLTRQADLSVPWKPAWGNLVETAFNNGKISDAQWERYAGNTLVPSLAVRPRIRVGDPLPMQLGWEKRFGDIYQWEVYPLVDEVSVSAMVAAGKRERGAVTFSYNGMASSFNGISVDEALTRRLEPGSREVKVKLELLLRRGPKGGSMSSSPQAFARYHARRGSDLTADVEVRGAETDPGWLVVNEDDRAGMLSGLAVASLARQSGQGPPSYVTAVINAGIPRSAGRRVIVIAGGRVIETRPGGVTWSRPASGGRESGFTSDVGPLSVDGETPAIVTVVLLPDAEAAKHGLSVTPYWGEAIIFRNVPVTDTVRMGTPNPPYFPATESIPVGKDGGVPQSLIDEVSDSTTRPSSRPATLPSTQPASSHWPQNRHWVKPHPHLRVIHSGALMQPAGVSSVSIPALKEAVMARSRFLTTLSAVMLFATASMAMAPAHPPQDPPAIPPIDPPEAEDPARGAPTVDVALLLDTSNSMDGLIHQAKTQLWTIVQQFAHARRDGRAPTLRVSLFEYGNTSLPATEGYLRQVVPLTDDLDRISQALFALTTNGGDEYCGQTIDEAVKRLAWSPDAGAYKTIFIAGNEPFTQGEVGYRSAVMGAVEKRIIVNTIHCGDRREGIRGMWQDGAMLGKGEFFNIDQDRALPHIPCPQDPILMKLNDRLNATYLWYGRADLRGGYEENQRMQDSNAAESGVGSQRAAVKGSGVYRNVGRDLVDTYERDKEILKKLDEEELPEAMQAMTPEERQEHIEAMARERAELQKEIGKVAAEREETYRQKLAELEGGEAATLGDAVVAAVNNQLEKAGFETAPTTKPSGGPTTRPKGQ